MRSPRHHLKKYYGEWRIGARRKELEKELSEGLGKPVRLSLFGDGGNDSIYLARNGEENIAVVRLFNPYKSGFLRWRTIRAAITGRGEKAPARPGRSPLGSLNREWEQYEQLADSGVTPRPLWRTFDAFAVAYLPGVRMHRFLSGLPPGEWWNWIDIAFNALARFHEYGMAHMDAKASNVIINEQTRQAYFIDLGRSPKKQESLASQKAFDFLKLISSVIQIAPEEVGTDGKRWRKCLGLYVSTDVAKIDITPLLKLHTVRHLDRCVPVRESVAAVFTSISG